MKIKIIEDGEEKVVRVKFTSIFKAWLISLVVYAGILVVLGLIVMKIFP